MSDLGKLDAEAALEQRLVVHAVLDTSEEHRHTEPFLDAIVSRRRRQASQHQAATGTEIAVRDREGSIDLIGRNMVEDVERDDRVEGLATEDLGGHITRDEARTRHAPPR